MKSDVCQCFLSLAHVSLTVGKCYRKTLEIRLLYVESHVITTVESPVSDQSKGQVSLVNYRRRMLTRVRIDLRETDLSHLNVSLSVSKLR